MIICYTVPEIWHMTHEIFIFHFGLFFALLPPNSPKDQNLKKMIKMPRDIMLHMRTKNQNHMRRSSGDAIILNLCNKKHNQMMYVYAYSDMECDRHNFLSF